jgi:hypothetical protein
VEAPRRNRWELAGGILIINTGTVCLWRVCWGHNGDVEGGICIFVVFIEVL